MVSQSGILELALNIPCKLDLVGHGQWSSSKSTSSDIVARASSLYPGREKCLRYWRDEINPVDQGTAMIAVGNGEWLEPEELMRLSVIVPE